MMDKHSGLTGLVLIYLSVSILCSSPDVPYVNEISVITPIKFSEGYKIYNPFPDFESCQVFAFDSAQKWLLRISFINDLLTDTVVDINNSTFLKELLTITEIDSQIFFQSESQYNYAFKDTQYIDYFLPVSGKIRLSRTSLDTVDNFISCDVNCSLTNIILQNSKKDTLLISEQWFKNISVKWLTHDHIQFASGWPVVSSAKGWYSSNFADIDNDGHDEIIASCFDFNLYVWKFDGSRLPGFPFSTRSYVVNTPAVGDVNGDGNLEIAFISNDGNLYIIRNNGMVLKSWLFSPGKAFIIPGEGATVLPDVVMADIDGDTKCEVIYAYDDKIHVVNSQGEELPGWPQKTKDSDHHFSCTPCVTDLDNDGFNEVTCGSSYNISGEGYNRFECAFYQWKRDGKTASNWPQLATFDTIPSSVNKIISLQEPGSSEKLIFTTTGWRIYAFHPNGEHLEGWPIRPTNGASDIIASDLLNDSKLKLITFSRGCTFIYNLDGSLMSSIYKLNSDGLVGFTGYVTFDVNNDSRLEIIGSTLTDSTIRIFSSNGAAYKDSIIKLPGHIALSPIVGDFNRDRITDLAIGDYGNAGHYNVWSLSSIAGELPHTWQRRYCTMGNTGFLAW